MVIWLLVTANALRRQNGAADAAILCSARDRTGHVTVRESSVCLHTLYPIRRAERLPTPGDLNMSVDKNQPPAIVYQLKVSLRDISPYRAESPSVALESYAAHR